MGIMLGSIIDGLGRGATSIGGSAMQVAGMDERQRLQEQMLQQRLASSERNVDARLAGAGGGGGKGPLTMAPGSLAEEGAAARMQMTVPEFRAFRASQASGDQSDYATDNIVEGEGEQGMGPGAPEGMTGISKATGKYLEAKRKILAEIAGELTHNGNYDDVVKGRQGVQQMGIMDDVLNGRRPAERVAEAEGAMKGEGAYKGTESGVTNQYTGSQALNELGKAKANDENASAGEHSAKGKAAGTELKTKDFQGLQQERISADKDLDRVEAVIKSERANYDKMTKAEKAASDTRIAGLAGERDQLKAYKTKIMERLQSFTEAEVNRKAGRDQPPVKPVAAPAAENPKPAAADKFTVGRTYKDSQGNRAKYLGGGRWENL